MSKIKPDQVAHMGFVQGVINRMGSNALAMKALAATIAAGVIAVVGTGQVISPVLPLAGLLPVCLFWILDAKYLRLEKLYRYLYDEIRAGRVADSFTMETDAYEEKIKPTGEIARSWSVAWFYLPIVVLFIIVAILVCYK